MPNLDHSSVPVDKKQQAIGDQQPLLVDSKKKLLSRPYQPLLFLLAFVVIGVGFVFWSEAASPNATGAITGIASKCIDNQANKMVAFNKIQLYTCNGTGAQQWTVNTTSGTPAGTIVNSDGYCLDVDAAGTKPSTLVDLYPCNGTAAQEWTVNASSNTIVNPHSGLCLDDYAASTADGNQIQIYTCNGTAAQKWYLPKAVTPAPTPTPTPTPAAQTSVPTATPPAAGNSGTSSSNVKPTVVGHELELGTTGNRLKMHGVAVWGIEDEITTSFGVNEYNNRQTVINTVKSWGGNTIRLRLLASDYNKQTYMTKAAEIQEIKNWQSAAQADGMYIQLCWWDSLDGSYSGANWAGDYSQVFPMMTDVVNAFGPTDPWVYYEPFNEPDNISESSWLTAMQATIHLFRTDGYTGILVLDTDGWSHVYNDADMTTLEITDASQTGMGGKNQIIFAKHDYANEYPNPSTWDENDWVANSDGSPAWVLGKHLIWESEFGNYNCVNSTCSGAENTSWSGEAATGMATLLNNNTIVGADAFLFGPWYDANAMTGSDNSAPTSPWGNDVETNFLKASQ
jgi:hypothetical protein